MMCYYRIIIQPEGYSSQGKKIQKDIESKISEATELTFRPKVKHSSQIQSSTNRGAPFRIHDVIYIFPLGYMKFISHLLSITTPPHK